MQEAKHTPGPWGVDAFNNVYLRRHLNHGHYITGAPPIAIMGKSPGIWPEDEQYDRAANARLIAAAPELLDGCNALLGLLQLICNRDDMPLAIKNVIAHSHRITEARVAIAKATASERGAA